jgi:hypothetical protein
MISRREALGVWDLSSSERTATKEHKHTRVHSLHSRAMLAEGTTNGTLSTSMLKSL